MKSNKTLSIFELQNKSNKIKRYKRISILLGIVFIIYNYISFSFKYSPYKIYLFIIYMVLLLLFVLFTINISYLSSYEKIRFNLAKLIEFLKKENYDKSKHHLNEIAIHLELLLEELKDIHILYDFRNVLNNFLLKLKFEIYPNISDAEKSERFIILLNGIQNTLVDTNYINLTRLTKNLNDENIEDIELPYEKPNILNQFLIILKKYVIGNDKVKFLIIYVIVSLIVLYLGTAILQFYNITPDTTSLIGFLSLSYFISNKFV